MYDLTAASVNLQHCAMASPSGLHGVGILAEEKYQGYNSLGIFVAHAARLARRATDAVLATLTLRTRFNPRPRVAGDLGCVLHKFNL